ncbi:hypothetical protein A1O3_06081 [Capronia epimyces CBS 606.96]|uniref:Major facilitator superfamily (MFS) profile domain-containing protein n=1 Tax=Capronia epimyces CBS 606.96 TaxID=1182542 RepID=W9XPV6_9EURO|nr:uncharacterized protein A1O3_06081 [Capronia epimyces CBS 606.96]EXJ82268.1 hypothetical protein A1O3_06081 [Capronia epimyces CBS 606.96]
MTIFSPLQYFNRPLALGCLLIALSSTNYGFDNQAFATTQAMPPFTRRFGKLNHATGKYALEPYWLSLFNSLNYIGFAAGVLIGTEISSRFGRRWCMFCMSCYALVTATIAVTSQHREQIMAARILNYIYVGMELAVVPVYQSEIVPAPARSLIVGTYQLSIGLGGLVINSVCRGTSTLSDDRAWRIPLGLFYIIPTVILSLIFLVPESPRWLLLHGHEEEAKNNLEKLRAGAFTQEAIETEFQELKYGLAVEQEKGRYIELFQGTNLMRTVLVIMMNVFQQATGQAFASQYGAIFISRLGTVNPFSMGLINAGIGLVALAFVLLISDRIGRRPLLFIGGLTQVAGLMTMGGLGTRHPTGRGTSIGIVSMMTIMSVGFTIGWAPMTYVVSTELPALRLKDLTMRVGFGFNVLFNFAVSFSVPYLIYPQYAGLESKVGFIFGSIAVLSVVFTYFCVPECKGKTLEQVDYLFQHKVPLRNFKDYDFGGIVLAGDGDEEKAAVKGLATNLRPIDAERQ